MYLTGLTYREEIFYENQNHKRRRNEMSHALNGRDWKRFEGDDDRNDACLPESNLSRTPGAPGFSFPEVCLRPMLGVVRDRCLLSVSYSPREARLVKSRKEASTLSP